MSAEHISEFFVDVPHGGHGGWSTNSYKTLGEAIKEAQRIANEMNWVVLIRQTIIIAQVHPEKDRRPVMLESEPPTIPETEF